MPFAALYYRETLWVGVAPPGAAAVVFITMGGECFLLNLLPRLMSHVPSHRLESFKLINAGDGLINLTY